MTATKPVGYWIDLRGIQFADNTRSSWIQLLPVGKYDHPTYGEMDFSTDMIDEMVANFKANVRGTALDIDYDHKAKTSKAAGWIQDVKSLGAQGLWGLVEWTPEAHKAIKDKEYRYFSPEMASQWTHPQTGAVYSNVLFGGGITNRPFLKDILPLNLSELELGGTQPGGKMEFIEQLRQLLQLSEDSDEAMVLSTLEERLKTPPAPAPKPPNADDEQLKKLAETNPAIQMLLAEREANRVQREADARRLVALEKAHHLSEVNVRLNAIQTFEHEGKTFAMPPASLDALRGVMVEAGPMAFKFADAVAEVVTKGLVELGERGSSGGGKRENQGDPAKHFMDLVSKAMKGENGVTLSYTDALTKVMLEDGEAYEAYREAHNAQHREGSNA